MGNTPDKTSQFTAQRRKQMDENERAAQAQTHAAQQLTPVAGGGSNPRPYDYERLEGRKSWRSSALLNVYQRQKPSSALKILKTGAWER